MQKYNFRAVDEWGDEDGLLTEKLTVVWRGQASGLARSRMIKTLQDLWQQLQQQQQKAETTKKAAAACMTDQERARLQAKEDS